MSTRVFTLIVILSLVRIIKNAVVQEGGLGNGMSETILREDKRRLKFWKKRENEQNVKNERETYERNNW